jgi:hypothetical protein
LFSPSFGARVETGSFNIENLVLRAKGEFNGFAGEGGFRFQCSGFSFSVSFS